MVSGVAKFSRYPYVYDFVEYLFHVIGEDHYNYLTLQLILGSFRSVSHLKRN